jgi:hypothetical protein
MNRLRGSIACLVLVAGVSVAVAAPLVPSSEMPGRERDRFTDSPIERFMRPGPYRPPQVIAPAAEPQCGTRTPRHSKPRSVSRKTC